MNRRSSLKTILATGMAPWMIPAHVLRSQTAPSNKITLGVIGVGAQGTGDMRAFLNHDDVRVVALCDVNRKNIERAQGHIKERYGSADAKVYSDFRELNRDSGVDAVLMALPVHWHSIPAADAVLNGKHIYHEKPMGMSLEESKLVRAAVRKKGVVFQFGTQQRSDLKFRWAAELAQNGRLGKLKEIQVGVPGGKTAPAWQEQPVPDFVDWERWVGPAPMTPFHSDKLQRDNHENITNFSLGMISCWGIHHLDIAQWGNGTDATGPVRVEGSGDYPKGGGCDAVLSWKLRFEYASAAPVIFANQGAGIGHGASRPVTNPSSVILRTKSAPCPSNCTRVWSTRATLWMPSRVKPKLSAASKPPCAATLWPNSPLPASAPNGRSPGIQKWKPSVTMQRPTR
jgi:predicted dehydrogenase